MDLDETGCFMMNLLYIVKGFFYSTTIFSCWLAKLLRLVKSYSVTENVQHASDFFRPVEAIAVSMFPIKFKISEP